MKKGVVRSKAASLLTGKQANAKPLQGYPIQKSVVRQQMKKGDNSMDEYQENYAKRILGKLGVAAWHKAGYTGKRGLTATAEKLGTGDEHARKTEEVFRIFAPDRELIDLPADIISFQTYIEGYTLWEIMARGVDTMYISVLGAGAGTAEMDVGMARLKNQCCVFASAGNDGLKEGEKYNHFIDSQYIWGVGACLLLDDNVIQPADYTSVSEHVDFAGPHMFESGTSFSAPAVCGMAALVNDMAIAKTGKPLTQDGMYRFLTECSLDIGDPGKDKQSGLGLPILPPPETVDIAQYQQNGEIPEPPVQPDPPAEPEPPVTPPVVVPRYDDDAQIPKWAKEDVYYCREHGFMEGFENTFRPESNLTRVEAAAIIARLHRYISQTSKNLKNLTPGRADISIAQNKIEITPEKDKKPFSVAFTETDGALQLTWPDGKTFKVVKP